MNLEKEKIAILAFFSKNLNRELSNEESDLVYNSFSRIEFKRKSSIFTSGESSTKHYFVFEGLLRLFLLDADGKEFNLLFARENQLIGDLSSPEKTKFNLSSIEKSIVYEIDNEKLEKMNKGLSNSNSLGDYMRRSYIFLQNRLVDILSKSAEENYENLLKDNTELLSRLPQYHIASYLGISPEFLSKTIAKVVKKQ